MSPYEELAQAALDYIKIVEAHQKGTIFYTHDRIVKERDKLVALAKKERAGSLNPV